MAISKYLKHGVIAEINDWKGVDLAERFCSAYPIFSTASMVINFQPWQCCKLATAGLRMNYRWSPYELQMAIKRWSTLYLRGSREGSVKKSKQFLHIFSSHFSIRIWSLVLAALYFFVALWMRSEMGMHSGAESVIYLYKKIKNKYRVHCDASVSNMKSQDLRSRIYICIKSTEEWIIGTLQQIKWGKSYFLITA